MISYFFALCAVRKRSCSRQRLGTTLSVIAMKARSCDSQNVLQKAKLYIDNSVCNGTNKEKLVVPDSVRTHDLLFTYQKCY